MSITIGNYAFEGPFPNAASLKNSSGVYAVLTRATVNDSYSVVDIGESGSVRDRVTNHDRQESWKRHAKAAGLSCAAYYCDERSRMALEATLRGRYSPTCGDR
jgi:hypothetical protein